MKVFALLALLGASEAVKIDSQYGGIATVWDKDRPHPGFPAHYDDFDGQENLGKYDRKIPD